MENQIKTFYSKDWSDYEMLDTGEGEKLERFGKYTFVRPYENAFWEKSLAGNDWKGADGKFWSSKTGAKGGWKTKGEIEKKWIMSYKGIKFYAYPTPFRHLGFFPEQASHWDFIEKNINQASPDASAQVLGRSPSAHPDHSHKHTDSALYDRKIKFLNLFGYTGVASLFALRAGAEVTHVDASKQTLTAVKENQVLSGLENLPMRIILDDAVKFLEREIKRGNKYDCVIMDPPKFGRGPKGEIWKLEENLPKLLSLVGKVMSEKPLFVILTSYAVDAFSLSLGHALADTMKRFKGETNSGELCVLEKSNSRLISLANTAVWTALEK
jgi:23S rRNA (cytosine1962-C5)-methyltransferase